MGCGATAGTTQVQEEEWEGSPRSSDDSAAPKDEGRWLWEDSPDVWCAFEPSLARQLSAAQRAGETRLVFTVPGAGLHEVDLEARVQTHRETGTQRKIRHKPPKISEGPFFTSGSAGGSATKQQHRSGGPKAGEEGGHHLGEWQWEAKLGDWRTFDSETAEMLAIARSSGRGTVVFYLGGKAYEADLDERIQTNTETGFEREIRWVPTLQFQWEMKNGVWADYEEEENDMLIKGKLQGLSAVRYQARGFEYEVNLHAMMQDNISLKTAARRSVRVAGADIAPEERAGVAFSPTNRVGGSASFFSDNEEQEEAPSSPGGCGESPPAWGASSPKSSGFSSTWNSGFGGGAGRADAGAAGGFGNTWSGGFGGAGFAGHAGTSPRGKRPAPRPDSPSRGTEEEGRGAEGWEGPPHGAGPDHWAYAGGSGGGGGEKSAHRRKRPTFKHDTFDTGQEQSDPKSAAGGARGGGSSAGTTGIGGGASESSERRSGSSERPSAPAGTASSDPQVRLPPGVELPKRPAAREAAVALLAELGALRRAEPGVRRKGYRAACLRWHPDKNLENEDIATEVFQFLQRLKDWCLNA